MLSLCGCGKRYFPAVNVPAEPDHVVEIKSWLAVGPFGFDSLQTNAFDSFYTEDLSPYGIEEGRIDEKDVTNLLRQGVRVFLISETSPRIRLFNYVPDNAESRSNFYLASEVYSAQTQDVTLVLDGSYSYTVWLNGDRLVDVTVKYSIIKQGDRFVNITLRKGMNRLFVKINRGTNVDSWDLVCAIAPRREAERIFRVNCKSDFVVNPVVNDSLEIYSGPYSSGKVELLNEMNQTVAGDSFDNRNTNIEPFLISGLKDLDAGFYRAVLTVGDEKLEEMIYKGDYMEFVNGIDRSALDSDDLKAAMQRVDFVSGKSGSSRSASAVRFNNSNKVFWGYALYNRDAPTQLMTYRDEDGYPGVFIFHAADRRQRDMPLVIVVPFELTGESMIEDWNTGNLDQLEADAALADEFGFAIAWIYAGGEHYSAVKTGKEIAAVIDRLHSEYGIDRQRIYLTGSCEGGRRALVQLAVSPDRYAACAVAAPIITARGLDDSPVGMLPRMGKVPILIRHGRNDERSPVEPSRRFYAESQKYGMAVEYVEDDGNHAKINRDYFRFAFEFFDRQLDEQKRGVSFEP